MSACFMGVPGQTIERFFLNMCAFDANMPHTETRLSPITFCDFMIRNQVQSINLFGVYEEANKVWKHLVESSPGMMNTNVVRAKFDLDACEKPHTGWNMMIDYLNRFLDVAQMNDSPYYQMHYIAHVSYLFNKATEKFDRDKCMTYRTIFNDLISPILYDTLIPTTYTFLPIRGCTDIRFGECLMNALGKVQGYIYGHAANHMNYTVLDGARCKQFYDDLKEAMTILHNQKYAGTQVWSSSLQAYFNKIMVYQLDAEMFEMYSSFKRDGLQHIGVIEDLMKLKKRFEKGTYGDEADDALDDLLDVYSKLVTILKEIGPAYEKEMEKTKGGRKK